MTGTISQRAKFVKMALEQMHAPYLWDAKGGLFESSRTRCFDCSGLVTFCFHLVSGIDWRETHNTDVLWDRLAPAKAERAGTLAFYGAKDEPSHVMILLGEGVVFGAGGGGRGITTIDRANAIGARVKPFPHYSYRPDHLGFRDLPFTD